MIITKNMNIRNDKSMFVKENKKVSFLIILIVFIMIFYYMLRVTTLVNSNNGIWKLELFTIALNEIYKLNTPVDITSKNFTISVGVSLFMLMIYETYRMQNKRNIQEKTYRFGRMAKFKRHC